MRRFQISLFLILWYALTYAANPAPPKAYGPGETLNFKVYYHAWIGNLTAGYASLKVSDRLVDVNGNKALHIRGEGYTRRAFNWFFKVNDRFETWVHPERTVPYKFLRRTREGNYSKDEDYLFDQEKGVVTSTRARTRINPNTHDIISAIYFARSMDFRGAEIGQVFPIEFVFDDEVYTSEVIYAGRDTVEIGMGTFACLKFKPRVLVGEVFDKEYPMVLWVTDDANKIPVLIDSEVLVGSVRLELTGYENLAHPFRAGL